MRNSRMLAIAKKLRRNQTRSESLLWQELRNGKMGVKFRRQMPFIFGEYYYVADFYCAEYRLIIELDGAIHSGRGYKECDEFREEIFAAAGYRIIRFKNSEVDNDILKILDIINSALL